MATTSDQRPKRLTADENARRVATFVNCGSDPKRIGDMLVMAWLRDEIDEIPGTAFKAEFGTRRGENPPQ